MSEAAVPPPAPPPALPEVDLRHPSAMVTRLGLLSRLFARIFFAPVAFPPRLNNDLRALASEGTLVYVMRTSSLLDYLYFNYAFARAGVPIAQFANGVSLTLFQPWRRGLANWFRRRVLGRPTPPELEVMRGHLQRGNAVLLFLRRAFSLVDLWSPPPEPSWLQELVELQRQTDRPLVIVPQLLVWTRDPERSRTSIIDAFFGDPEVPGRLRKLFSFLLNHRRAQVQVAEAIRLPDFLAERADCHDDRVLAEQLRHAIEQALKVEQRVIRGVPIKPPPQVRREILADDEVRADLTKLATETGKPIEAVAAEAEANLREIGADYRMWMVSFLSFLLTLLWARIYEGIEVDEAGLERVREAGRRAPVVVTPSHKSHIDYLVLSYLFYTHGLIPPHIAAGANLSFFPLGWVFRRGGAFFLRRSFSGQPIYASIFRHYVRKLLADGHWLEFFPEGGRSRTGKLLPPKYGLIRNALEAVADGKAPDIAFMPSNFGYERLIEEKAYRKELEGGEKKAESPVEVLKATSVLVHKYGRIRIQFGQPIYVREFLEAHGVCQPAGERDAVAFERAVKVFGYELLGRINDAGVITPTALVSAVLLTKIQRGLSRADLLMRVGYLLAEAKRRGAVLSDALVTRMDARRARWLAGEAQDQQHHQLTGGVPDPLGAQSGRARELGEAVADVVDQALTLFEQSKWILRRPFADDVVYIPKTQGRLHLDYYKNNLMHLFVPDALLAAAILAMQQEGPAMPPEALIEQTKFLSRLLKFEFVYAPGVDFEHQYEQTLQTFLADGWLTRGDDGALRLTSTVAPVIRLYAKLLQNFIESYSLMGRSLAELRKGAMAEAAFLDFVQQQAAHAFELGDVQCYESISKVNLSNALMIFVEQKHVVASRAQVGKKSVKLLRLADGEQAHHALQAFCSRIGALHAPWRAES